jgi:hypothetical protein
MWFFRRTLRSPERRCKEENDATRSHATGRVTPPLEPLLPLSACIAVMRRPNTASARFFDHRRQIEIRCRLPRCHAAVLMATQPAGRHEVPS